MTTIMNARCGLDEERLVGLDLVNAFELMDELGIESSDVSDIEEALTRIRHKLTPQLQNQQLDTRQGVKLKEAVQEDENNRQKMKDLFTECKSCLSSLPRHLQSDLQQIFPSYLQQLEQASRQLAKSECFILVAGEKGSGKSSVVNLLAGSRILPIHMLHGTRTVCELRHSETKRFVLYFHKATGVAPLVRDCSHDNHTSDFLHELANHVTRLHDDTRQSPYEKIEIFWPLPVLGQGMVLVDSPGIGESQHIPDQLQHYLTRAAAFIYVINISNAGGIHRDRLGRLLRQTVEGNENGFDPSTALFVCNWWDQVSQGGANRQHVLRVTQDRLVKIWPGVQRQQLFPLSAKEALRAMETGHTQEEFVNLVHGLHRVLPTALKTRLLRYYSWITAVLKRALYTLKMACSLDRKRMAEKEVTFHSVRNQIEALECDAGDKIDVMRDGLQREVDSISRKLRQYLRSEACRQEVSLWCPSYLQFADCKDNKKLAKEAASRFAERLASIVDAWECNNNVVAKVKANILKAFQRDLDLFEDQLQRIECVLFEGMDKYVVADFHSAMLQSMPVKHVWKIATAKQSENSKGQQQPQGNSDHTGCLSLGSVVSSTRQLDSKAPAVKDAIKTMINSARSSNPVGLKQSRRATVADFQAFQAAAEMNSSVPEGLNSSLQGGDTRHRKYSGGPSSHQRRMSTIPDSTLPGNTNTLPSRRLKPANFLSTVSELAMSSASPLASVSASASASARKEEKELWSFGEVFPAFLQQIEDKDVAAACNKFFKRIGKRFDAVSKLLQEFLKADRRLMQTLEGELKEDQRRLSGVFPQLLASCTSLQGRLDLMYVQRLFVPEFTMEDLPYDAKQRVGKGSFADVYSSRVGEGEKVALKIQRSALTASTVTDILLEDRTLRNVKHENIVGYYGAALEQAPDGEHWVMVLEFCACTMKQRALADDTRAPGSQDILSLQLEAMREVALLMTQICSALCYLHNKGIVHRDLKPDNVLLTERNVVKLCDVGLAKHVHDITLCQAGTPVYMAPEILSNTGHYDTKADIYSLAVILWELWYCKDVADHITHFLHGPLEEAVRNGLRPSLTLLQKPPDDWITLIQSAWEFDPSRRPTSQNMGDFFRSFLSVNRGAC